MSSEVPPASEVCREYFGTTDSWGCVEVMTAMNKQYRSQMTFGDKTCDTSLFPYQTPDHLETPIPTPAEIALARNEASMLTTSMLTSTTWRVGPYVVKVGKSVDMFHEAENLIYLERNTNVRAPKLYAAFASEEVDPLPDVHLEGKGKLFYYVVMEYIDGQYIGAIDEELKGNGLVQNKLGELLGEQLRKLRSVPPEDSNHFGRVNGRAFGQIPPFYHPPGPDFDDYGPFNYEEVVKRLIHSAQVDKALGLTPNDYSPMFRLLHRDAKFVFLDMTGPSDRLPVLSHMNLDPHSIMAKLVRDEEGKAVDVEEVVIVDWKFLCWMPSWYEAGDMCRVSFAPVHFYNGLGHHALDRMGHVNMTLVAFFAMCVEKGAFFLVHL
ncbi:hypothetical protein BDV96DRAFT_663314 [Lophiotrema nucula]|uniref:Aminoglycoside phosphotransferase domain-containing protein n=1 Tax=Lophiotrema nucula TaxID=690887 RepID=A0A6A5ZRI6_9PLEO|nr:hypothetical protein BDV96DRAFT_663314 [Lophiotrema nucula]